MKKIIILTSILISSFSINQIFGQESTAYSNEKESVRVVRKGNFILDPYYGAPNFGKSLVKNITFNNQNINTTGTGGIGPAGLRAEYMLADKFGLGVDVIFNSTKLGLTYDSLNPDNSLFRRYEGELAMKRVRVQLRFNYHFVSTNKLDAYVGIGAGSNTRIWSVKNTDPNYQFEKGKISGTLLPFSMRAAVGLRYYFIPNLGINAEIGIGGPLVSAGISFKI